MQKQRILAYLKARKTQGAKFYIRKKRLGVTALKAVKFELTDIGDELVNYFLTIESDGGKIFVSVPSHGLKRVHF